MLEISIDVSEKKADIKHVAALQHELRDLEVNKNHDRGTHKIYTTTCRYMHKACLSLPKYVESLA